MGRRRVIALLLLSSILLITLDIRGSAAIDRLRSGFSLVLSPFDTAARAASRPVINAWQGITNYDDLLRENERLRERIAQQRGAEIEARAAIIESQALLQLNQLIGPSNYPNVVAQVQGASPSNFQYTIEIDKGTNDGVGVGMPVVNGAGLVGKITQVFPSSSIVLLITDPEFSIGAKILVEQVVEPELTTLPPTETLPGGIVDLDATTTTTTPGDADGTASTTTTTTVAGPTGAVTTTTDLLTSESEDDDDGVATSDPDSTDPLASAEPTSTTLAPALLIRETGTLRGQGPGRPLIIDFIDQATTVNDLQVGSPVETAGGASSIAPASLPIGVISAVTTQTGSSAPVVEVEPAAGDLTRLTFLSVVLYRPNTGG